MRKSRITFDIETAKVRTIVELLIDQVSNFSVNAIEDPQGNSLDQQPKAKSVEWAKPIAVTLAGVMHQHGDKNWHYLDPAFGKVAKEHGVGPASISAVLLLMCATGRAKRVKRGYYKLVSV